MALHGRELVQLLLRLEDLEAELARVSGWLDQQDSGNTRAASLIDQASLQLAGAVRELQRGVERELAEAR